MSQNSTGKPFLLHPIENHRHRPQTKKTSSASGNPGQNDAAINTEPLQSNFSVATNTPNYAEEMIKAIENGDNTDQIVQQIIEAELSESYWKKVTEQRRQAIEETKAENQQLHSLIDDLSKENDRLRIVVNHCDYLQDVLEKLTADSDSLFDETHDDDTALD